MTNSFDYPPVDLGNPRGNNGLSAEANYYQRSLYNEAIYPDQSPRPLDTWYGKIYYGKVDTTQTVVIPRRDLLVPVGDSLKPNQLVNPVVALLFRRLVAHMRRANLVGVLDQEANPQLIDLQVHTAYQSPQTLYEDYLERLYNAFVGSLNDFEKNKIHDFPTYISTLLPYLKQMAAFAPITKTAFMATPLATRFGSSLSIAIASGNFEDDAYKYRDFINDPNFIFYSKAAKKFGFMVEKNMPWVLTADLFTDAFLAGLNEFYTPEYEVMKKDKFFPTYFVPTSQSDLVDLILFIVNSYNLFVRQHPLRDIVTPCASGETQVTIATREGLPEGFEGASATYKILTDKQMIDLYLDLRYVETKKPFKLYAQLRRDAYSAYKATPFGRRESLAAAATVIDTAFRPYLYDESYFAYANLDSINFMVTGVDTGARSANIVTTTTDTSTSSY